MVEWFEFGGALIAGFYKKYRKMITPLDYNRGYTALTTNIPKLVERDRS